LLPKERERESQRGREFSSVNSCPIKIFFFLFSFFYLFTKKKGEVRVRVGHLICFSSCLERTKIEKNPLPEKQKDR
jgi:hypothetical protein